MENQKNLILAIVFSVLVLLVFDTFFTRPQVQKQQETIQTTDIENENFKEKDVPQINNNKITPTADVSYKEDRIFFNMNRISGSINLYGATLDDLKLKDYRKTINEGSNNIALLKKENSKAPFYVRNNWASQNNMDLPNKETLWTSEKKQYKTGETISIYWENSSGIKFTRNFTVDNNFIFKVEDIIENNSKEKINVTNYSLIQRKNYKPKNQFFILHEGPLGVFNDTLKEVSYDELEDAKEITETTKNGWIGITDHYWQVVIFPEADTLFKARFRYIEKNNNSIQVDYINDNLSSVLPGKKFASTSFIFAGAKEVPLIDSYIKELSVNKLDLSIDFGWFYFLTKPLFYALNYLSLLVGNFGVGIIILTIFIRIILFPLANKSFKSMNSMRLLTPEIQRIRERYKEDRTKMNQEMFSLYKEKKINPASGCLPILVQIPIFFALYKVLFVSIEMRHAPFFGWIKDLSAPDPTSLFNFFGLIPWEPPGFLMIGIWPILMGLTMYLQQKINPPPPDPIQAKIFLMLPFVFTFLLATFPAGMVVYWTVNNILSITQQSFLLNKQKKTGVSN